MDHDANISPWLLLAKDLQLILNGSLLIWKLMNLI